MPQPYSYDLRQKVIQAIELDGMSQRRASVDLIEKWWIQVKERFPHIRQLVINQDNGPENHSRRTQFMQRVVTFAHQSQLNIQLAYDPPYHSKYSITKSCQD